MNDFVDSPPCIAPYPELLANKPIGDAARTLDISLPHLDHEIVRPSKRSPSVAQEWRWGLGVRGRRQCGSVSGESSAEREDPANTRSLRSRTQAVKSGTRRMRL